MGSQQFCLKWNNHQLNMLTVFDQLLQNEAFVDVTIACDGLSLRAHKMVLSACSPYFQNLFMENPCKHPIVILKDIRYDEMKAIIDFMYKGEVNVSQEQLSALLKTAETLKVKGLAEVTGQAAQQSQAQQQAVKQSVLFESVPARTSPPAKRKKRPPAAAGSPASPGTNNSSHSGSFPRPPSPPSHSHIQSAISLAPIASSVPSTSTSTLHHHEMASEEEHILPSSGLMRVSAAESGPSTSSSEHKNFDPKGFDPLPMNMKEEKVDLDEPPDEVEDLIMEATPEHIEIEPTTDTGFNGSNQEQGSLSQLASVKYGSVYNPSLPSTSGSSTGASGPKRESRRQSRSKKAMERKLQHLNLNEDDGQMLEQNLTLLEDDDQKLEKNLTFILASHDFRFSTPVSFRDHFSIITYPSRSKSHRLSACVTCKLCDPTRTIKLHTNSKKSWITTRFYAHVKEFHFN